MTDPSRPDDASDESERLRDSFDIDDSAREHPAPSAQPPAEPVTSAASGPEHPAPLRKSGTPEPARARGRRGKPKRKAPWWELPALIALAIVIAILVKTFLFQPFYIPSQSMEKTLHGCPGCAGDRILVSKVIYDFRDPEPGDIVVFNAPNGWNDEPPSTPPSNPILRAVRGFGQLVGFVPPDGLVLVKRVIAVGGQSVKGVEHGTRDDVYVRDAGSTTWRKLDEPFVYMTGHDDRGNFGPVTVPQGRLWVMGDHRDQSQDSRWHCLPNGQASGIGTCPDVTEATVPVDDVIGKAVIIAWPPSRWTTLGTPKTFEQTAAGLAGSGLMPVAVVAPVLFVVRRRRRRRTRS